MHSPAPSPVRWLICGLLLLATTLNYLDRVALNQLVNTIMVEFHLDDRDYANLESAFDIAFGLGTLFTGWLVDRVNVRWVYPVIVLGWSVAGFCTGYANTFATLMLCRVLLGLFEAGNWPCGIRTTRTVLAPEERSFGNALFQSGTAIGAILTPQVILLCYYFYGADTPGVWRVPFRAIGLIGLVWIALWLIFAPRRLFPPPRRSDDVRTPFWHVFRDRRFWVLVVVILGVNTSWHTTRVWMPRLLKETHGYDKLSIQSFGTWYYLAADIGSWTVGLLTLLLVRKGSSLGKVRLGCFLGCTALLAVACGVLPRLSDGYEGVALIVIGFAALGLFPTYFALSQDLSAQHQGKVTGTLGCINALYMAGMKNVQGEFVADGYLFEYAIAFSSGPAFLACLALLLFWRQGERRA